MKQIALILILIVVISCKKNDNPQITPAPPRVMPEVSCSDTTDDGKFEQWDLSQWHYHPIGNDPTFTVPDTELGGPLADINLYQNAGSASPDGIQFRADTSGLEVFLFIWRDTAYQPSWGISPIAAHHPYSVKISDEINAGHFPPGCYRLYYAFFESDTKVVYTKGHFDINVL